MTNTESKFMEWDEVVLRPVEKEDAEFLAETISHEEVRNHLGRAPFPISKGKEEDYIENLSSNDDQFHFIIEYKEEKAGHIFLERLETTYGRSEVGYAVHPDHHGKGIGTKSLKMIVTYAFDTLNLHKIRGGHLKENTASKRILEKTGFQKEGVERDYKYVDGEWKDAVWMSILEDEYYDQ